MYFVSFYLLNIHVHKILWDKTETLVWFPVMCSSPQFCFFFQAFKINRWLCCRTATYKEHVSFWAGFYMDHSGLGFTWIILGWVLHVSFWAGFYMDRCIFCEDMHQKHFHPTDLPSDLRIALPVTSDVGKLSSKFVRMMVPIIELSVSTHRTDHCRDIRCSLAITIQIQ